MSVALADDCSRTYEKKLMQLEEIDAQREAKEAFCNNNKHFKILIGIEHLMLGVPEKWRDKKIPKEKIFYSDGIKCDEHRFYLEALEKYVINFNLQMVQCLEQPKLCCPDQALEPSARKADASHKRLAGAVASSRPLISAVRFRFS